MLRTRYIEYKEQVVKVFYQQHFLRFDRQIVLADCLTPLNACSDNSGPESFADLQLAIDMILESYSYGQSGLFSRLFSPKIDKLLFAATKADHVTAEQHGPMVSLLNQLIYQSQHKLNYDAIEMKTLAIAAVKSTTSGKMLHKGQRISVIQGNTLPKGEEATEKITLFPGAVPDKLPEKNYWQQCAFNFINFLPITGMSKYEPLPHIRMDQVLQFLLADKMT
jgi:predicted YcjX-like family ATPase